MIFLSFIFFFFFCLVFILFFFFFFSSRRRHTRWNCDWSSDVCSSDLPPMTRSSTSSARSSASRRGRQGLFRRRRRRLHRYERLGEMEHPMQGNTNYVAALLDVLAAGPDRPALHWKNQSVSGAELRRRVIVAARVMRGVGIGADDVVGILTTT